LIAPVASPVASLPTYDSLVATATSASVPVYPSPAVSVPSQTFPNPWLLNNDPHLQVPLVFSVIQRQGAWLQVLLPIRPNGSSGWVRASDVALTTDRYRVEVGLAAHQITVYDANSVLYQGPVAVGAAATPTPTGRYFTRVLMKAPDPTTVYGPYAYGLSGYSPTLQTFEGSDAEVGIHGNNDASVLGQSISHGCVRMDNAEITKLSSILPLGTPVQISA
jgi:lipoprotein-anchoring transpeptidase ErfK/SrfK